MLVSFYVQISIIVMSFLLALLPFLGLPQSFDKALTAILAASILGVSVYALYSGYVRILKREEKRREQYNAKEKKHAFESATDEEEEVLPSSRPEDDKLRKHDYSPLHVVRD